MWSLNLFRSVERLKMSNLKIEVREVNISMLKPLVTRGWCHLVVRSAQIIILYVTNTTANCQQCMTDWSVMNTYLTYAGMYSLQTNNTFHNTYLNTCQSRGLKESEVQFMPISHAQSQPNCKFASQGESIGITGNSLPLSCR